MDDFTYEEEDEEMNEYRIYLPKNKTIYINANHHERTSDGTHVFYRGRTNPVAWVSKALAVIKK